jgi:translation initiation factor IF-2
MSDQKGARLSKLAKEFNVGITTIVDFLKKKGHDVDNNPNTKVSDDIVKILEKEYSSEISVKKESEKLNLKGIRDKKETISIQDGDKHPADDDTDSEKSSLHETPIHKLHKDIDDSKEKIEIKVVGKIDLNAPKKAAKPEPPVIKEKPVVKQEIKIPEIIIPEPVIPEIIEVKPKIEVEKVAPEIVVVAKEPEKIISDQNEISINLPLEPREELEQPKVVGRIDLDSMNLRTRPPKKSFKEREAERRLADQQIQKLNTETNITSDDTAQTSEGTNSEGSKDNIYRAKTQKLTGPTVVGRIDLPSNKDIKKPVASSSDSENDRFKKKKRKRIKMIDGKKVTVNIDRPVVTKASEVKAKAASNAAAGNNTSGTNTGSSNNAAGGKKKTKRVFRQVVNEEDVQKQIKDTLARLTSKGKSKTSKYRREKRDAVSNRQIEENERNEIDKSIIKVTEFVTVSELATMMDVPPTKLIGTCMSLGLFVSINQRLDAETIAILAEEYNFKVEFVSIEIQEAIEEVLDKVEDLKPRPPIVTVMGHVDHGKTKLLDFIRNTNVIAGEAGGITQHIGAYGVQLEDGRHITFLDTPGHEAFTAMRARGAKITDIAIIVVAADDGVMPQTREAINHAQAAGVPIVFAINKIDKQSANPEKIKEELAQMNLLVEDWGGKFQSQEVSAKSGLNIDKLLEKVLLEAEMLDLKANPDRNAKGNVVESSLDKGRGYVSTILVETGTLKIGDLVLAGTHIGRVKAMYNERGKKVEEAGPSSPVLILGLNGAPQAGDEFHVLTDEKEAKDIATKREQLQREQGLRTKKHITLDEIGRRIAIGNFKELNVIVKGDVDGSVEALSDSLIKLSTPEIQVSIIHKAVGQISESDILLAAASNAIVIGFQVRPSVNARKIAEKEQIEIRLYSIIYDAIEELKDAMEGMLSPEIREEIVATLEIREVFNITKVGTIAGCMMREGKIQRSTKVRVIRDGIVVHTGNLASLKRFKDDVKEVVSGQDCGLNIENFNNIQAGDIIEGFKETEVRKKL